MFLAIGRDAERHDEAVLADVHAVDQQADQVERVERGGLPRGQLRGRLGHEAAAHRALAGATAAQRRRHRLQTSRIAPGRDADQHLLDHAAIQRVDIGHGLECGQGDLLAVGAHARSAHRHLPATEHHLTAHGAGPRRPPVSDVRVPQTADRGPILFQHRFQHLQTRTDGELEQLAPRIDQEIDQPQVAGRFNSGRVNDCARLPHGGSFAERRDASVWPPLVYHEQ